MDTYFPQWLDALLLRHPLLMAGCLVALSLVACWVLIAAGHDLLVYEGF